MKTKELKKLPTAELTKLLTELTTELSKNRFLVGNGESKLVRTIRRLRRERAQMLTEITLRTAAPQSV